jgi:cellulose synthase operon protein C
MTPMRAVRHQFPRVSIGALAVVVAFFGAGGCQKTESVEQLLAKAEASLNAGDYQTAVFSLNTALAQDPKSLKARMVSAEIYIDLNQGDAALGILLRAEQDGADQLDVLKLRVTAELATHRIDDVVKHTETPPAAASDTYQASLFAYRGLALAALGNNEAAQDAFQRGLALDPHSVDIRIALARFAIASGKLDVARQQVGEATKDAPKDRRLRQIEGDIAYAATDYAAAEQIYQKLLQAEPWNDLARGDLAASQLALNKVNEAAAVLDTVLNDPDLADVPKDPLLSHIRAVAAYRLEDYALAQSYSEKVVARAAGYEPARLIAAASSYALGEYERANYYISPYVNQEPDDLLGRKLLAAIQLHLNHPGDAAKTLAPVRDTPIDDPDLLAMIGVSAAHSGDLATADEFLKQAVRLQPDNAPLRIELGRTELALGNTKAGIADLEQALKAKPEALGVQVPLFLVYMRVKDYDKALAIAEQMKTLNPTAPTGYLLAASVHLSRGDIESGRAALMKAREVHPGDVNANRNLAKLAFAEGKIDEACGYLEDILKYDPKSATTYIALADLEVRANRVKQAEVVLSQGAQENPQDVMANAILADLLLAEGKPRDALATAQRAMRQGPQNPAALEAVGRAQLALDQRDDAIATFRNLTAVASQAAWAHADLAEAYLSQYTPDSPQWQAINEAAEAVKLAPQDRAAKVVLARAQILHGRFAEAHKVVDPLKQDDGGDVAVAELDGLLARGEGRLGDAATAFSQAVALKDNATDRKRLADTQLRLGLAAEAEKTMTAWLAGHPDDIDAHRMVAEMRLKAGRLAEASEEFAVLVRLKPDDADSQNNLAWTLSRLGRPVEALAHAKQAAALAPDSADILDTFGEILLQSGQASEAVTSLTEAWENSKHRADIGFHRVQALAANGNKQEALELLRGLLANGGAFEERTQAQALLRQLGG